MQCITPSPRRDFELLDYLDGQASPQVSAHVQQCAVCAAQIERLAVMRAAQMPALLHALTCPDAMELGEYALGVLAMEQASPIKKHLRECPSCQESLEQLKAYWGHKTLLPSWIYVPPGMFRRLADELRIRFAAWWTAPAPALALSGLKGLAMTEEIRGATLYLDPELTGGSEVEATLLPVDDKLRLTVRVIMPERWPDLAGITVRAWGQDWAVEGITDEAGEMIFDGLPDCVDDLEVCIDLLTKL